MYKTKHVVTNRYSQSENHEELVQEALDGIGEAEIYSIQHTAYSVGHNNTQECYSTVIVYREYAEDHV